MQLDEVILLQALRVKGNGQGRSIQMLDTVGIANAEGIYERFP